MTPISPFISSRSWLFLVWMTLSWTRSGVAAMVGPSAFRRARRRQRDDLLADRLGARPLDEEEVAQVVRPRARRGRLTVVDRVRGADDQRARGLAEDLGQADHGDAAGLDEVVEHATRADGGE